MLTFIKDLGLKQGNRQRENWWLMHCSGCGKEYEFRTTQIKRGYTNWCKQCGKHRRTK